jgi:predicted nucleic acid-binding protein
VCICGVILTEVLQGIREDEDHAAASAAFDAFLFLPMTRRTFIRAADLYRTLRRRGVTIRNAVDCMIASVAIEHDIPLLHNDRDFDGIATLGNLKVVKTRERPSGSRGVISSPLPHHRTCGSASGGSEGSTRGGRR